MTVSADKFLRRFLRHVLPRAFVPDKPQSRRTGSALPAAFDGNTRERPPERLSRKEPLGVGSNLKAYYKIVGVADNNDIAACDFLAPGLNLQVEHVVQVHAVKQLLPGACLRQINDSALAKSRSVIALRRLRSLR